MKEEWISHHAWPDFKYGRVKPTLTTHPPSYFSPPFNFFFIILLPSSLLSLLNLYNQPTNDHNHAPMADAAIDTLDIAILGAVLVGSGIYWFKDKLLGNNSSPKTSIAKQPLVPMQKLNAPALKITKTARKTRDFVEKMKETVRSSFHLHTPQ